MYVESSLDGPDAQGVEPRPSGPSSTEYESPLVARSLGMPSSAAAADCPTSDTASSMGGGPAVTRTMRSSSSYEKFERHEEVREMHTTAGGPMPALAPQPQYHHTPSRFQFACDTSAPTELSKMQDEAQKRRELFHARVAEIEKRAASWTARLANETIDRELHHEEVMEKSIKQPLEDAAERVMDRLEKRLGSHSLLLGDGRESEAATNNDDDNDNADKEENARKKVPSIMALDRKATDLEEKLIQHSSNSYNARVEHFDTKIDTLTDEVQPALRLETIKADQREAVLNRQYIAIAADATRWYAEENAARVTERVIDRLEKRLGSHSLLLGDGRESEAATNNDDDNDNADKEENARKKVPSIMALDRKATDLEEKLIQHSSNSYNARVEHFDTKIDTLTDEVQPALRLETIKADQREAVLNRQYIAIAADATRWYAEENAARVAEHQMLRTTRNEKAAEQPPDAEKILADIRAFRQLLEDERSERQRADEEIMSTIIETRKAWQKIVIESLGE